MPTPEARRRARHRVATRGAALFTLSAYYVGIGASWIWPTAEQAAAQSSVWRDSIAPTWVWGALWIAVGCSCLVAGIFKHLDADWGFGPAGALMLGWAAIELVGWRSGDIDQGYRPTLIWLGQAAIIWFLAYGLRDGSPQHPGGSK